MSLSIKIRGIGTYIPEKVVKNDFFIEHFKKEEWGSKDIENLLSKLGRDERHLSDRSESSLTMAVKSAKDALSNSDISVNDIDMIVFVSDTPEYTVPTNAMMITQRISAKNADVVFDMNCNCTGMIVALDNVSSFLKSHDNVNNALVVGSFHASSVVRFDDAFTYGTFGDASVSMILTKEETKEQEGVLCSKYYTDSEYCELSRFPACGSVESLLGKQHKYYRRLEYVPFDAKLFVDSFTNSINSLFEKFNISDKDIAYYAFSQLSNDANINVFENLGIEPDDRYLFVADRYGYTGNTSPFLALSEIWNNIEEYKGKYVIIISVAVGFSTSAILYKI